MFKLMLPGLPRSQPTCAWRNYPFSGANTHSPGRRVREGEDGHAMGDPSLQTTLLFVLPMGQGSYCSAVHRENSPGFIFTDAHIAFCITTCLFQGEGPQPGKSITLLYSKEKQISQHKAGSQRRAIFAWVIHNSSTFQQQPANK